MEKSIDSFVEYLKEEFQLEDQDLRTYVRRRSCMSVHQSSSKLLLRQR